MAKKQSNFIANQVFVGLPWKNVRPKYEEAIKKLEKKYPTFLTIVGRDDGQDSQELFTIIKQRIIKSSHAIFDVTGGNPNVSLEFGFAEGIEKGSTIFLGTHKAANKQSASSPIISDLGGKRRIQYKNKSALIRELGKFCKEHDYTKRFEKALKRAVIKKSKGDKKSLRSLTLKLIRFFDGKNSVRREELVSHLQAEGYNKVDIEFMIKKMGSKKDGIIETTVGRYSLVSIA